MLSHIRAAAALRLSGLLLLLAGCGSDTYTLIVDVRTDLVPVLEVAEVQVFMAQEDAPLVRTIRRNDGLRQGVRVGEFTGLGRGLYELRAVFLVSGVEVGSRQAVVTVRSDAVATLVFSQTCRGVMCPAEGNDADATTCNNGRCVPPTCTVETPELCATSVCSDAAECPTSEVACAIPSCSTGVCLLVPVDGACALDETCSPSAGCVWTGVEMDAGTPELDASPPDAPTCSDASECDDGVFCNGSERCLDGACTDSAPVFCDDSVDCTSDICDEAARMCAHVANDEACSAESGGRCESSGCQYPSCTAASCMAGPCQSARCEGDMCVRTSLCGMNEMCCAGACVAFGCDDGDTCTSDMCGVDGCAHVDNDDPCDDGNACTDMDLCSAGICQGQTLTCDDANPCTDDDCDPAAGCVSSNNTAACDDGNSCTLSDQCAGGSCTGGSAVSCNDGNVCTTDTCSAVSGCVFTNNTVACNDGNDCSINDSCSGGTCGGTPGGSSCLCGGTCLGGSVCVGGGCSIPGTVCVAHMCVPG